MSEFNNGAVNKFCEDESAPGTAESMPLGMYEISGQGQIGDSCLERYQKDKQTFGPEIKVLAELADTISNAPEAERAGLIQQALDSNVLAVQVQAISVIRSVPSYECAGLIRQALDSSNPAVRAEAVSRIWDAPKAEQAGLREKVTGLIQQALDSSDPAVQVQAVYVIGSAPEAERAGLIQQALDSSDPAVQVQAVSIIRSAPEAEQTKLAEKIGQTPAANSLIEPSLYIDQGEMGTNFDRRRFPKTGSETTLLGGDLKGKVIIRHLTPKNFLAWQKLYEDSKLWEQQGFDYVPIEPIVAFRLNKKNGLVEIASGVLDMSLKKYLTEGWGKYKSELQEDRDKILSTLKKQDIFHGHSHDSNFCLRFFRAENGKLILSRKPRIYLIDFDQAFSSR